MSTEPRPAAKLALYEAFAEVGKALASPLRLLLLDLLAQAERSVDELAAEVGAPRANTSAQLQVLHGAALVSSRKEGTRVYYRLASDDVARLVTELRTVAHAQLAEVERAARDYLGDLTALEPVSREELTRALGTGRLLLLDVRPAVEHRAGHIPAARSMPLDELGLRIGELPRDVEIVAYCRGRFCVYAPEAVRLLRDRGFAAHRLEDGFDEWRRAGGRVEVVTSSDAPLTASGSRR
jgi:rhodanese-related sulfurtransferase/DNA-binding transcriptional ArsR family regulator